MANIENQNKKLDEVQTEAPNPEKLNEQESTKADNAPETSKVDEVNVDALEDETMKLTQNAKDNLTNALEQTENEADGKIGTPVTKKKSNYARAGLDKAVVTAATVRSSRPITGDTNKSFIDIDPEEKDAARIQQTIEHIGADIVKEGTPGVTEDYINPRQESNVAIERETMDSVQRTVGLFGTIKVPSAGGATQAGNVFMSVDGEIDLTDHMYHTGKFSESAYSKKNMDYINGIVLNEYDASGKVMTDTRRFVPLRHVAVVGIDCNPIALNYLKAANADDESNGYGDQLNPDEFVTLGEASMQSGWDWASNEPVPETVRLRMPNPKAHKLFKVIEITPMLSSIKSATQELMLNASSLDERKKLGEIEAITDALMHEDSPIASDAIIPKDVELHPNYGRCSLYTTDPNAFDGKKNLSCCNSVASVAKFLKYLNQSEAFWLKTRLPFGENEHDMFRGYKMRKNFSGKDESLNYYNATLKANIRGEYADGQTVPGVNTFCAFINTNPYGRYETKGNLLYKFGDLKRKVKDYIDKFATNEKLAGILTVAYTKLSSIEEASKIFQTGKLPQNGSLDILAKMGGTATLFMNFDPNDLISYQRLSVKVKCPTVEPDSDNHAPSVSESYLIKPFVAVGYRNSFRVDSTKINGLDQRDYLLAPSWVNAICDIFTEDNATWLNRLYNASINRDQGRYIVKSEIQLISEAYKMYAKANGVGQRAAKADTFYQPLIVNPDHPEWVDFFLNEMLFVSGTNDYLSRLKDNVDGYLHLMEVFQGSVKIGDKEISFKDYINDGGISVSDAIAKLVSNPLNYANPNYRKVSDMTPVTDEAAKMMGARHSDHQIAVIQNTSKTFSIQQCDSRDIDVDDLAGLELIPEYMTGNETITAADVADKAHVLMNARTRVSGANNAEQKLVLVSIGESEFIVCYQKSGHPNEVTRQLVAPVMFRRKLPTEDEARYGKKRITILADGADPIDHLGESIDKALYGHDGFYFNENCDGYVLKVNKHSTCTLGVHATDSKIYKAKYLPESDWTMSLCPCKVFSSTVRVNENYNSALQVEDVTTAWVNDQPVYTIPFITDFVKQPLKSTSNNTQEFITIGKNSFYLPLDLLSMYSGKRMGVTSLANYTATEGGWKFGYSNADIFDVYSESTGDYAKPASRSDVFNAVVANGSHALLQETTTTVFSYRPFVREDYYRGAKEFTFEIFAPHTAYAVDTSTVAGVIGTTGNSSDLTNTDFLTMFDKGNLDITIATYWDRQYYRCTRFNGKQIKTTTDRDASADIADATIILAGLNLGLCPEVYANVDEGTFTGDLHPYGDSNFYLFKTPGNHLAVENIPMIYEAFEQFADGRYTLPLPAKWFFAIAVKRNAIDDYGVMATMPNNLTLNPVLNARYYRRDYCDYIAYKPIVTLNKNWEKKYNINSKLSDTFYHAEN